MCIEILKNRRCHLLFFNGIYKEIEGQLNSDNKRYKIGNYFKTKEEAEKVKVELDKFWKKVRAGEIGG